MKILVIGSNGMAGHVIKSFLGRKYKVETLARTNADHILDIENMVETKKFLQNLSHDFIINCIGVLGPDSNTDIARTVYVNAYFPKLLEKTFENTNTRIVHISTDCVFDGKKGSYIETDIPNEPGIYGFSKGLGEINNKKDLTLRISIIGPEKKEISKRSGLLNWILTSPEKELSGWTNALWNGITTLQLAKCIDTYIQNPKIYGIWHPVPPTAVNKAELLEMICAEYDLNKSVKYVEGPKTVDKTLVNTKGSFFKVPSLETQLWELEGYSI